MFSFFIKKKKVEKVYCCNCGYFTSSQQCSHPENVTYVDTPIRVLSSYKKDVDTLNENNDCILYSSRNRMNPMFPG